MGQKGMVKNGARDFRICTAIKATIGMNAITKG